MEKFIILIAQSNPIEPISFIEELCECNADGTAMTFDSLNSADVYREDNGIDGYIVQLPMY